MKKHYFLLLFFIGLGAFAQQPYYDGIDFTLPPAQLYNVLQNKLEDHNANYSYGQARDMMKVADEWEEDNSRVVLIYGYNDNDNNCTTDYTRHKDNFGGQSCEYNREHVFPRSLANPGMGRANNNTIGIAADPHNIRAADQQANQNRQNYPFGPGSGNARVISGQHWYPGDEWKGDVARMMMYMYVRYGERCLPSLVGTGATQNTTEMLELFLEWNIEDPVSYLEIQRNDYLEDVYGNRNPFIDNPYLATVLWGGEAAEDRWGTLATADYTWKENIAIYPNPASESIWIESNTANPHFTYTLYNLTGQKVYSTKSTTDNKLEIPIHDLTSGVYILHIHNGTNAINRQILVK